MKIAICDNEEIFVKKLYEYLWQQPDCSVQCFTSPSTLLQSYEGGERYDVLFLDILMKPFSGLSLSRKIRSYDSRVIIVFLTAYLEYAPAGYEVNAFRYLLKPVSQNDISQLMTEIRREFAVSRKLLLKTPQCELILNTEDILYFETNDKETTIYYEKDTFEVRRGLNELAAQLPPSLFFRIHRKYIVNLAHVREFDEKQLTLDSGHTLSVSRRKSQAFRKALEAYIEGGFHG